MTCIIGFIDKKNKTLHMIGDSLGSNGYTGDTQKNPKICRSKDSDGILLGSTSTFRQIDILKYNSFFEEKDILKKEELNHEYMVTKFIPALQKVFSKGGILIEKSGEKIGGSFLIGTRANLYEIQGDFSVLENTLPWNALGCGEDFAKASLFTTKDMELTIKEKLILAISSAEKYSTGVARPFTYMNTKGESETID